MKTLVPFFFFITLIRLTQDTLSQTKQTKSSLTKVIAATGNQQASEDGSPLGKKSVVKNHWKQCGIFGEASLHWKTISLWPNLHLSGSQIKRDYDISPFSCSSKKSQLLKVTPH